MDIDKKTITETLRRNILLRLERESLKEEDLPGIAHISREEAAILLKTGGANGTTLYQLAKAFNCAVDDFFLGIYDEREKNRSAGTVNGDRLKVINSLQDHDLLKELADISNQELRDSVYALVTGLAGIFRFLDMQGLQMQKAVG
jgi:hypothetical protein